MRIITRFNPELPLSTETIGYNWPQPEIDRPDGYPYYHWIQTEKGSGLIEVGYETFKLPAGTGFLLPPGMAHRYYPVNNNWETAFLTFGGSMVDEIVHYILSNNYVYMKKTPELVRYFVQENFLSFLADDYISTLEQSALIYHFLLLLDNKSGKVTDDLSNTEVIAPMIDYIKTNYATKITNRDLEKITNFSISYINKVFKKHFGLTPQQYLTDFRLRKAKELLVSSPALQIQEIAMQTGFNDVSYFIKTFRDANKVTPSKFRNRKR